MPEEIMVIAVTAVISGTTLILGLAGMFFSYRAKRFTPGSLRGLDDRLTRMEQAIDAIAIEVERISEGVRFTSKVLVDRAGSALPSGEPAAGSSGDRGSGTGDRGR
jgi:hypothetical protein